MGASVSGLISILSRTHYFLLSGLLPFFPTFVLIAHMSLYDTGDIEKAKSTSLFMIFAMIPILGYNFVIYKLIDRIPFIWCIVLGLAVWFILAYIVYMAWLKYSI